MNLTTDSWIPVVWNDGKPGTVSLRKAFERDSALVCAVCQHESTWDPWAAEHEPEFEIWLRKRLPDLSPKAYALRSTSFGLMQVMGQVALELGFPGRYLTSLCDPRLGLEYGCRKLANCIGSHTTVNAALLAYNGGGDPTYPFLVLKFYGKPPT
jgi:hypothetical protein